MPFSDSFRENDCEWQLAFIYSMKIHHIRLCELTDLQIDAFIQQFPNSSELQHKACLAYRDFLISIGGKEKIISFSDEKCIYNLFSERFLAKCKKS